MAKEFILLVSFITILLYVIGKLSGNRGYVEYSKFCFSYIVGYLAAYGYFHLS